MSDTLQRRKLLQAAQALKKSGAQRLNSTQSTAPVLQPAGIDVGNAVAQRTASSTSDTRPFSRDNPQGNLDRPAASAAAAPSQACPSGSCKIVQQRAHKEGKDRAGTPGLQPASGARRGLERSLASSADTKRPEGAAAVPQSNDDAAFADQPGRETGPPPRKFAKLSRSMLSRRKTERPVSKACSVPTAAAAAKQHLSAGSSLHEAQSKEQSAMPQGTSKAHSMPTAVSAAKHHVSTATVAHAPGLVSASQEHTGLPVAIDKALGRSSVASPVPSEPEQSSHTTLASGQPACLEALQMGGESKQATGRRGGFSSVKDEPQPVEDSKPAAYLSGALGHLLATR